MVDKLENSKTLPIIALRGLMLFPGVSISFDVGRSRSIQALEAAMQQEQTVMLCSQYDTAVEEPADADICRIGTVALIKQIIRVPGGNVRIFVEGLYRAVVLEYAAFDPYMYGEVARLDDIPVLDETEYAALDAALSDAFENYAGVSERISADVLLGIATMDDLGMKTDAIAFNCLRELSEKQEVLEITDIQLRAERVMVLLAQGSEIAALERQINIRVRQQIEQLQKEHYLHEQIKAIHQELGDGEDEIDTYRARIAESLMSEEAKAKARNELVRLEKTAFGSPDGSVIRSWLDWVLDLPWGTETQDDMDIKKASQILEEDHYGLNKVKERTLEYLSIRKLTGSMSGPILCFVGPPGVGKTSIAKSIARALGRNFTRMSLGGMRDEAEIRGHRKTYIGAQPGRIATGIKYAGSMNPVFLFDEIDKTGNDFRGDPASALLEALDSQQNNAFRDHYLEVPLDLSSVMFIATANTTDTIPPALLDRMELIEISGYTAEEKLHILRNHLLPRQLKEHGLDQKAVYISDDGVMALINGYTREAGVRSLDRELAAICRKVARKIAEGKKSKVRITEKNLEQYLGIPRYIRPENSLRDEVGRATGLAWTSVGGETLSIEVNVMPGSGALELTGQLGDVMKESAKAALSYIRAHSSELGLAPDFHNSIDIHLHVPQGAIPKDGPSAGITITTAMVSALTGRAVRGDVAMTGEITLRGIVLPIGGLKEKALAAHREGIKTILVPRDNKKDITEIPANIRNELTIVPVSDINEVFARALCPAGKEE